MRNFLAHTLEFWLQIEQNNQEHNNTIQLCREIGCNISFKEQIITLANVYKIENFSSHAE
jgi:hypothetical protein